MTHTGDLPPHHSTSKPLFAPRKRARHHLMLRSTVLAPHDALRAMKAILGSHFQSVQEARFIYFVYRHEAFRYTIAVLSL